MITDPECTHLVVDDVKMLPSEIKSYVCIVKPEWFWASVQMEICADERVHAVILVSDSLLIWKHQCVPSIAHC